MLSDSPTLMTLCAHRSENAVPFFVCSSDSLPNTVFTFLVLFLSFLFLSTPNSKTAARPFWPWR
jgi:hypothetical protein